jgi:glycine dehydrogenase subunit 1
LAKSHYAAERIGSIPGFKIKYDKPFIKEFVVETPVPPKDIINKLSDNRIAAGIDLGKFDLGLDNCLMIAVTEKRSIQEIDSLVEELSKFAK